ncbi:DUF1361 domain-containing protein [soil metagenome]
MSKQLIKVMAVSSALSIILLYFRIQWSGSLMFVFLPWNLFLAWIPFLLAMVLSEMNNNGTSRVKKLAVFFFWLLFFPNSPYILTDLFHLKLRSEVPLWFDLVLILSFAWNGLLLGFSSLFEIQKVLRTRFSANVVNFFITCLMVLCSFGIYLGRYPRYNSWDIISNPITLFSDIFKMIIHPMNNTRMVGVTFFFSVFLMVSFWTLNTLINHKRYEDK